MGSLVAILAVDYRWVNPRAGNKLRVSVKCQAETDMVRYIPNLATRDMEFISSFTSCAPRKCCKYLHKVRIINISGLVLFSKYTSKITLVAILRSTGNDIEKEIPVTGLFDNN